jgi:sulfide dehydrogenase cytochrome subunit
MSPFNSGINADDEIVRRKSMRKITRFLLAALLGLTLPFGLLQADVGKIAEKCDECHGEGGNSTDGEVPNIAGMSAIYLGDTLTAYVEGDRKGVKYTPDGGEESDMEEVAAKLSEGDISAIAEHYAAKTFKVHVQDVDADMAKKGRKIFDKNCDKCHGDGGSVADDDAGLLLGQWKPYLEKQFRLFEDGTRAMTKKMKKKFDKLSDQDKAEILEYLAGGKL